MPILVQKGLPASDVLRREKVFVMNRDRASVQDIRPLRIGILNLMPTLEVTETQLIRMLANTPLQVEIYLIKMDSDLHDIRNLPHLEMFYKTYEGIIREQFKFDGLIITGAPLEQKEYEEVDYWDDLCDLMDYTKKSVFSTIHICWGAQAGLYHHYGIQKHLLEKKLFGVFPHTVINDSSDLVRGFDDLFYVPQSRYSQVDNADVEAVDELTVIANSEESGAQLITTENGRWIFLQGHWEYDKDTLRLEYERDVAKGLDIDIPVNYFVDDNPFNEPRMTWKAHGNLFYENWLNYVYQNTPYDLEDLETMEW